MPRRVPPDANRGRGLLRALRGADGGYGKRRFLHGAKEKFSSSHDPEAYRLYRKRFVGGAGTYPLIGTPRKIAEELIRISEVGFAGTTVSFVNFRQELPYFISEVLPLLRKAGLRR